MGVTLGIALALLVLGVLYFSTGMFRGTGEAPPASSRPVAAASMAVPPRAAPAPATTGRSS
ncbi:hypothetical protein AB5I41_04030 [Sphingomonas sp. MMS24-JH45]